MIQEDEIYVSVNTQVHKCCSSTPKKKVRCRTTDAVVCYESYIAWHLGYTTRPPPMPVPSHAPCTTIVRPADPGVVSSPTREKETVPRCGFSLRASLWSFGSYVDYQLAFFFSCSTPFHDATAALHHPRSPRCYMRDRRLHLLFFDTRHCSRDHQRCYAFSAITAKSQRQIARL